MAKFSTYCVVERGNAMQLFKISSVPLTLSEAKKRAEMANKEALALSAYNKARDVRCKVFRIPDVARERDVLDEVVKGLKSHLSSTSKKLFMLFSPGSGLEEGTSWVVGIFGTQRNAKPHISPNTEVVTAFYSGRAINLVLSAPSQMEPDIWQLERQ